MLARPVFQLLNHVVWRGKKSQARKLMGFARTERGSALTLRQAAAQTQSTVRQALYLRHAADEDRHARLFAGRSRELCPAECAPLHADAEDLFAALGEMQFLAFVHHAESRGRRQFEIYEPWFAHQGDTKTSAMLSGIIADEKHHEQYSYALLIELAGSEKLARRSLRQVRHWEAWRVWRRIGQGSASGLYTLCIWLLCPLLLPYALYVRWMHPALRGWRTPDKLNAAP